MTLKSYQKKALETWSGNHRLTRSILGISGEAGEVAEVRKKYLRADFGIDKYIEKMTDELGDVLYNLAVCAAEHQISIDDIANDSIEKMSKRHKK